MSVEIPHLANFIHDSFVRSLAFHPTANPPILAVSGYENVTLFQLSHNSSFTRVATLGHIGGVTSIMFHPTANPVLLATGCADGAVRLWQLNSDNASASCLTTINKEKHLIRSVAFHPTANPPLLATGGDESIVKIWQLLPDESNKWATNCLSTMDESNGGHTKYGYVSSVAFHPTANPPILASGSERDRNVKIWQLVPDKPGTARCLMTIDKTNGWHGDWVNSVAFHPTSSPAFMAIGGNGGANNEAILQLWQFSSDNSSASFVANLEGHKSRVNNIAFHPTANVMASTSRDNTI